MIKRDLEFWNRRSNATTILTNLRWAGAHIWTYARAQALGTLLVHIMLGIQPALLIYVVQHLIDAVVKTAGQGSGGFAETLPWLIAFGLTHLLTSEVLWNVRDTLHMKLEQNLTHALGHRFLAKSTKLPLIFFEVSEFYNRLERANPPGQKLQRLFFSTMSAFQAGIKAITVAAMFASVSPWISLVLLAVLLPQIRLEIAQSRMFMAFTYGETEEERKANYVNRLLTGREEQKEVRLFTLQEPLTERWKTRRQELRNRLMEQKRRQVIGGLPVTGLRIAVSVSVATALAYLLGDRALTPGHFVALFQGVNDMLSAGGSLGYNARELQAQAVEVGYVREFLNLPEENNAWTTTQQNNKNANKPYPNPLKQGLTIDNVYFAYPSTTTNENTRPVLQGVSFHLKPGERVALVGENGSGKSTLAKILLGLYTPTSGRILADGIAYTEINHKSLTNSVGAAFQDYFNFELTLAQSIGMGVLQSTKTNPTSNLWPEWLQPDPEIIKSAAQKSGAHALAEKLTQGYDTPIGHILNGGQGLSGGEWQRIAVGRAFTRDPQFLIFDEPAAALDPMAEAALYDQISKMLKKRTALLISHRLGSARMADRILVLKDGRIVEEGHHDALLKMDGLYATMWEEQASWYR